MYICKKNNYKYYMAKSVHNNKRPLGQFMIAKCFKYWGICTVGFKLIY